jgi:transcriptional adapter 3
LQFDPTKREDDEITSALRQCQRQLLQQVGVNDARKTRLAQVAKDRLAYAEYLTVLEGLEKSIETEWAKRVKKHGLTPKKNSSGQTSRPPVSENLKKLVATRQRWIDTVGQVMREKKGDCYGLPMKSIYEGISAGEDEEKDERSVEDAVQVESGDEE